MLRTYVRLRCSLGRLQITFTKLPVSGTLKCNIKALTGPLFNELDGEDCRMRHLYLSRQNMLALTDKTDQFIIVPLDQELMFCQSV